jgi:hypothetical protein
MRRRRLSALVVSAAAITSLGACATMMHGVSQQVGIASAPAGARVTIDSVAVGVTPLVTSLSRGRAHDVRMALEGFEPFEGRITRTMSGWTLLDYPLIFFIFPVVVDASTGGMFSLRPAILSAELRRRALPAPSTPPPATHPAPPPPAIL